MGFEPMIFFFFDFPLFSTSDGMKIRAHFEYYLALLRKFPLFYDEALFSLTLAKDFFSCLFFS